MHCEAVILFIVWKIFTIFLLTLSFFRYIWLVLYQHVFTELQSRGLFYIVESHFLHWFFKWSQNVMEDQNNGIIRADSVFCPLNDLNFVANGFQSPSRWKLLSAMFGGPQIMNEYSNSFTMLRTARYGISHASALNSIKSVNNLRCAHLVSGHKMHTWDRVIAVQLRRWHLNGRTLKSTEYKLSATNFVMCGRRYAVRYDSQNVIEQCVHHSYAKLGFIIKLIAHCSMLFWRRWISSRLYWMNWTKCWQRNEWCINLRWFGE